MSSSHRAALWWEVQRRNPVGESNPIPDGRVVGTEVLGNRGWHSLILSRGFRRADRSGAVYD